MGERMRFGWVAVCGLFVWCAACANSATPDMGVDGESHFLQTCDKTCAEGLSCIDGVCTQRCADVDECVGFAAVATCEQPGPDASDSDARCEALCAFTYDCSSLGSDFECLDGLCRVPPPASGGPGKLGTNSPCRTGTECASGICEGKGCGEDALGRCSSATGRICPTDLVLYCSCDGQTFEGSSGCPGQRYAHVGSCEDGPAECQGKGRYQAGKEGSYLPCCQGLTEVFWQVPATDGDGNNVCMNALHREYGCVEGSCGDGMCEPGEDGACGCVADCPDAAWATGAGEVVCEVDGVTYPEGADFQDPLSCNTCTCEADGPVCTRAPCPNSPDPVCADGMVSGTVCLQCRSGGGCARYASGCLQPCLDCGFGAHMVCDQDVGACTAICE